MPPRRVCERASVLASSPSVFLSPFSPLQLGTQQRLVRVVAPEEQALSIHAFAARLLEAVDAKELTGEPVVTFLNVPLGDTRG